ncbi:DUF2076 domain-containing protein [Methylobacterium terricola]|uniref:DUF2076 domain-containing protein n=1 Tax=Methylobacterium terricola TaxID=2583531 RepID=A0A5C4LC93_9HYPH|nr:DUF2076 domain-containing protein [Methylobacterium terricola]TNC10203.1 DUF2076 domain-containing protein [Methylobacterium terricola]
MNSEERDVINGIFQRLEQAAQQPRDADAERFIADKIRAQPYAPYAMAQLVYVQEEAIKSLNQQLEQARAEAQRAGQGQGAGQGSGGGGFFSSIFGGGSRPEPQQPPQRAGAWGNQGGGYGQQPGYGGPPQGYPPQQPGYAPQQGGPWGGQPQAPQQRGGGFLATALPMAAGAAGGMLLGSALSNAFAGGHSSLGSMAGLGGAGTGGGTVVENNYFGNQGGSEDFGAPLGGDDAGFQDASFDGDMGDSGSDDWV